MQILLVVYSNKQKRLFSYLEFKDECLNYSILDENARSVSNAGVESVECPRTGESLKTFFQYRFKTDNLRWIKTSS